MLKFSILVMIVLPWVIQARNVLIEKVNYTSEVTTPLSMTMDDGKAHKLTEKETTTFETTNFQPTLKPLKATTLSESSSTESAIQIDV